MEKVSALHQRAQKQNAKVILLLQVIGLLFLLLFAQAGLAQTIRSVSSGDWNNPATWAQGNIPGPGNSVEIMNGHRITISSNVSAGAIDVYPPHNSDKQNERTEIILTAGSSLLASSLLLHNKNDRRYSSLTNSGGTVTVTGNLTTGSGCIIENESGILAVKGILNNTGTISTGSATLAIAGTYTGTGIFIKGTGTVMYTNSNGSQSISSLSYHHLQLSGGTYKAPVAALSVSGNLLIDEGTTLHAGNYSHTITGDVKNNGTLLGQGSTINVGGNWINNSAFEQGTSTINLNGPVLQTIAGNNTFYNFNYTGTAQAQLHSDLTITNSISVAQSHLLTQANTIWLEPTAAITTPETDAAHIIGSVQTSRSLTPAVSENFGNIGLTLTRNDTDPGVITVERLTGMSTLIDDGTESVTRQYTISRSGQNDLSSLEMTMDLEFLPKELNSKPLNEYKLYNKSKNKEALPVPSAALNQNTIRHTNSNRFGTYTLAPPIITPMPVELISFSVSRNDRVVALHWVTASEQNNSGFEVQASTDGHTFKTVAFVASHSPFSSTRQNYTYTDNSQQRNTKVYYRLKQIDFDGKYSYSKVQVVAPDTAPFQLNASPNPFTDNIRFALDAAATVQLTLTDLKGSVVLQQTITPERKEADGYYTINTGHVAESGIYVLRIQTTDKSYQIRLLKR